MNWKTHLILYLNFFIISWGTYALIITPIVFMDFEYCINDYLCLTGIDMTFKQYTSWLWQGAIIDIFLAYPVGRLITRRRNTIVNPWKKLKAV